MHREPAQKAFLREVQDWASGKLTGSYSSPDEIESLAIRAIHDWEIRETRGTMLAPKELYGRATEVSGDAANRPELIVAMAFGPAAAVMSAREFETSATEECFYEPSPKASSAR